MQSIKLNFHYCVALGAMTWRWHPPTRYTLRHNEASIIKDLIYTRLLAVLRRNVQQVGRVNLATLRPGNTAPIEKMSQRWQAVGETASDLTALRFEP